MNKQEIRALEKRVNLMCEELGIERQNTKKKTKESANGAKKISRRNFKRAVRNFSSDSKRKRLQKKP